MGKDKGENNFSEYTFLYNSFIFRTFFLIIEKLISNNIFPKDKESILSIYKVILILDKITNNNQQNEFIDINNIIEIRNNSISKEHLYRNSNLYCESPSNSFSVSIEVNGKDICFYTNFISRNDKYINLEIIDDLGKQNFEIEGEDIYFYNKVKNINITYNNKYMDSNDNDNFIIKIIPLTDGFKYTTNICNENYKIISLIQKTIIYYLLSLFEDIHSQIDIYNNDKNDKNKNKIY